VPTAERAAVIREFDDSLAEWRRSFDELRLALDSGNLPRAKVLQDTCSKALDRAVAAQRRSISMLIEQIDRGLKGEAE
jgi:uncharacterized coiled-coil protein SlyX